MARRLTRLLAVAIGLPSAAGSCGTRTGLEVRAERADSGTPTCAGESCSGICVDLGSDPEHCGSCDTSCPSVENGRPVCAEGRCKLNCDSGFHACGVTCTRDDADTACGAACVVCPTPPHGRPVCVAGRCDIACDSGRQPSGSECAVAPPRLIGPLSTSTSVSRRPSFRFAPAALAEETEIDLCADPACSSVIDRLRGTTSATSAAALPGRAVFWRARSVREGVASPLASPIWELFLRTSASTRGHAWGRTLDVDRDGRADVAIGVPSAALPEKPGYTWVGAIYLYRGVAAPLSTPGQILRGIDGNRAFGERLAPVGDANGDGFGDLLVQYRENREIRVFFGGPSGLATSGGIVGRPGEARVFADALVGLGDVNGDGYADVAASDHSLQSPQPRPGRVYVYYGGPTGFGVQPDLTIFGVGASDGFGQGLAGPGDVDGDGYEDLVVGATVADGGAGNASVYLGGPGGLRGTPDYVLRAPAGVQHFGVIGGAGDVNGDGLADLVFGVAADRDPGRAFVYLGVQGAAPAPAGAPLRPDLDPACGWEVGTAGDLDGDGDSEIWVMCPGRQTVYVFRGGSSGVDASSAARLSLSSTTSRFAIDVAGVGDWDGDGAPEIAVGTLDATSNSETYLFRGGLWPPTSTRTVHLTTGELGQNAMSLARAVGP